MLAPSSDHLKQRMMGFWGEGWVKRSANDVSIHSVESLLWELAAMRPMVEAEEHNMAVEMRAEPLEGKLVLEVGCGNGNASVTLAQAGGNVVAVDLTYPSVALAVHKFRLLDLDACAVQADVEKLPFCSDLFDVVYSNGVLHHTPDIEQAIAHIHRVLKPGGRAVIMLYAKWSFRFLVQLLLVQGIVKGNLWRHRSSWLGGVTEGSWITDRDCLNPITRVYSRRQVRYLFRNFEIMSIRQSSFYWPDAFPVVHRLFPRRRIRLGDALWFCPSKLEVMLGRLGGFALNICVRKPG
jgi:SAM-dependent methyltransferase